MARPCKSSKVISDYSQTKAELGNRKAAEDRIKGNGVPVPPKYLSGEQVKIFKSLVKRLKDSEILSALDNEVLAICAVSIDRIADIERRINSDENNMLDVKLLSAKDKYTKDFFRCCNELCLSPQSRAKIANVAAQKKDCDPLIDIIKNR